MRNDALSLMITAYHNHKMTDKKSDKTNKKDKKKCTAELSD